METSAIFGGSAKAEGGIVKKKTGASKRQSGKRGQTDRDKNKSLVGHPLHRGNKGEVVRGEGRTGILGAMGSEAQRCQHKPITIGRCEPRGEGLSTGKSRALENRNVERVREEKRDSKDETERGSGKGSSGNCDNEKYRGGEEMSGVPHKIRGWYSKVKRWLRAEGLGKGWGKQISFLDRPVSLPGGNSWPIGGKGREQKMHR